MHHFYRNRLVRCYLGASRWQTRKADWFTGFDAGDDRMPERRIQIGGRVLDQNAAPIANAIVDVVNAGQRTQTDADGLYRFLNIPAGANTIRVVAVGFQHRTQVIVVPAPSGDYDITLTPL